jgi:ornithine cyclodeaminase/alanine dehydrogenase-like protein (mu-crystallin family)
LPASRALPPLRFLSAADVVAAMPPLAARIELAKRTMVALNGAAELPPKIGVHPRPEGSFAHVMPAFLRGGDPGGAEDLLGMKWIAGFPGNRANGLPALHGVVLLIDPLTGVPSAVLDAGPITAERTAAVSGSAIAHFRRLVPGRPPRAAIIGAGVQGRSHLPVVGATLPGAELVVFDRHPERAADLAKAADATPGIGSTRVALGAREAVEGADVVITAASFAPPEQRQTMTGDWFAGDALVVAVDYATCVAAEVANDAALFVVDHREQFLANRDAGAFDGYPDPATTLGEAFAAGTERPASGRVVVTHLGVGLADLVLAAAILPRAEAAGLGQVIER